MAPTRPSMAKLRTLPATRPNQSRPVPSCRRQLSGRHLSLFDEFPASISNPGFRRQSLFLSRETDSILRKPALRSSPGPPVLWNQRQGDYISLFSIHDHLRPCILLEETASAATLSGL